MYWVEDYKIIQQDIKVLEESLARHKRELNRWLSGDLAKYKLEKESRGAKLEEIIDAIKAEIQYKQDDLKRIEKLVATFEGTDNVFAYKRYIEGKPLSEIATELNLSISYVTKKSAEMNRTLKYSQRLQNKENLH